MDAITLVKKKSWQRKRNWFIAILLVGSVLGIYKVSAFYQQVQQTMDEVYTPIQTTSKLSAQTHEPFSMLLLGVDERGEDGGRSDTMVVLTVNEQLQTTKLLSIPRDMRVAIGDEGFQDKINHAYAFGGTELAVQTVEGLLAIPIHYAVRVNMESFVEFVDIVGGIAVQNPFAFYYEGFDFPAGGLTLDGERALKYVRMRFEDPDGDFGRQKRQRQVLEALVDKGTSFETLLQYEQILHVVKNHLEMNLTLGDVRAIQKNYTKSLRNIESLDFQHGKSEKIQGIYYYIPDAAELADIQAVLQQHLQL